MKINLTFDQNTSTLPAGFVSSVASVAALYDALFTNPITVTVSVGYGEANGIALSSTTLGESYRSAQYQVPYGGQTVLVPTAEYKALGYVSNLASDGEIGFNNSMAFDFATPNVVTASQFDLIAVAEHEMSEVLGRVSAFQLGATIPSILDMLRYSAPGTRATAKATTAYFSVDGGVTALASFNTGPGGDLGDWASSSSGPHDAFDATIYNGTEPTISGADLAMMNALGYGVNAAVGYALVIDNPVLDNFIVGSGTGFALAPVGTAAAQSSGDDLFLRSPGSSQLGFVELANNGGTFASGWFDTPNGTPLTITPTASVVAVGFNVLGAGGRDVVLSDASGVAVDEINGNNTLTSQLPLTGATTIWNMAGNGGTPLSAGDAVVGGSANILFQNASGAVTGWQTQGGTVTTLTTVGNASAGWTLLGAGTLFGSDTGDLLFEYKPTGAIAAWQVENGYAVNATLVGETDSNWIFAGIGDLSGGTATNDLLFISDDGYIADWDILDGRAAAAHLVGQVAAGWSIAGIGGLTGNGQNDILFRHQDGTIAMWTMQNGVAVASEAVGVTTADWQIAGISDVNHDGTADILFRNSNGAAAAWLMRDGHVAQVVNLGVAPDGQFTPTSVTVS